jgi:transcriptional regulator with XRE-family HTH domain
MILESIGCATPPRENAPVHKYVTQRDPRDIIKALQEKHGIASVRQLAIKAGIQQPSLSRYLNGQSKTMEVESFQALAELFGVTVSELLGETPMASKMVREASALLAHMDEATQARWVRLGKALVES